MALTLSRSAPAPALLRAGAVLTGQYVSQLPIAPGRPTGAVWQIPPTADLLEVRPGTVLTGKLVQAPNGERAVRTAAGTLPVSPNLPASTGAQLRLGVLSAEAPLTLALLSQRPPLLTAIKQWVQSWTGRAGGSSDAAGGNDSALSMRVATVRVPAASVPPPPPPRNTAHGIGRTGGGIGRTAGGIGRTGGGIGGTGGGITRTTGDGDDGACIGTGGRGSRTAITSHDERRRDRKSRPWVDRNPHQ